MAVAAVGCQIKCVINFMKPAQLTEFCVVCQTPTDKCCGLCRKVFYCSASHQESDWHTRHKFNCEGRQAEQQAEAPQTQEPIRYNTNDSNFLIYSQHRSTLSNPQPSEHLRKEEEYQKLQSFLQMLEQRLLLRHKILGQLIKVNERSPQILLESLVRQTEELMELSALITHKEYLPSYARKISHEELREIGMRSDWAGLPDEDPSELAITETGVFVEYIADNVLMLKVYHLAGLQKEAREMLLGLGKFMQEPEQEKLFMQSTPEAFPKGTLRQSRLQSPIFSSLQELLRAIIEMSELYNMDKISETMFRLFIKKVETTQGDWECAYAYFNMGTWYCRKTYYDKAIKAYQYVLSLVDSSKKKVSDALIFKADCHFNMSLSYWALAEKTQALEQMQEAYRCRVNSIGKNSLEASNCLMKLAEWFKEAQKWNECLQYLDECHRIRKNLQEHSPEHQRALEKTKFLIAEVYHTLGAQKKKAAVSLDPQSRSYYHSLLEKEQAEERSNKQKDMEESEALPKDSFTSRLFRDDRQLIKFRVSITPEMFETYSTDQLQYLSELIDLTDEQMEKSEAIQKLAESQFVSRLTEEQRDEFMKANRID